MEEDASIVERIDELAEEQRRLRGNEPTEQDQARLDEIETELNQCWDLLRQRRAREDAGLEPDDAEVRPPETVDTYVN